MSEIKVVQGEIYKDHRGIISSLNALDFEDIKRCYFIHHPDISVVRGWHGHQYEKKWFYCIKGSFILAFVKIDDFKNPSEDLKSEMFSLSEQHSEIICLPEGYANCIKAKEKNSILQVYSNKIFTDALEDSWRYDSKKWINLSKY